MLPNVIRQFLDFFKCDDRSDFERYIASKNPQTPSEVDFWVAEYDNERRRHNRFIALQGTGDRRF